MNKNRGCSDTRTSAPKALQHPPELTANMHAPPLALPQLTALERARLDACYSVDVRAWANLVPDLDMALWEDF